MAVAAVGSIVFLMPTWRENIQEADRKSMSSSKNDSFGGQAIFVKHNKIQRKNVKLLHPNDGQYSLAWGAYLRLLGEPM